MNDAGAMDELMGRALAGDAEARERARELLGLDELNWSYFLALYQSKLGQSQSRPSRLYEAGAPAPEGVRLVYPVATAPRELSGNLEMAQYGDLVASSEHYERSAATVALWVKKMQAGSGSSLTRQSHLARVLGLPENQVRMGAKGTDLFVDIPTAPGRGRISLAEAQLLQSIRDFERGEVGEVIFHDIVSSETEAAIEALWKKPSLTEPSRSYDELVRRTPGLSRFGRTFQSFVPTLTESGRISFSRKAPAGHALFAVDALRAAYRPELRPRTERPLIAAISNGEDLSSGPDRFMIGYVARHRIPIALVTTERTAVDLKGGIVSLLRDDDGSISLTVFETAQAKAAGQEELFSRLHTPVSTNLTLFNYEALVPLIAREVAEIGEDRFLQAISPDLISNWKEQKDPDGVSRRYLQLEGAMGSTIMNLDRYWRRKHARALVHLINVDRMRRTEFFSPIKSAFDYFMQFHSDRFAFDEARMRLRNLRPGELPRVTLLDPATGDRFYQDVENVLRSFHGTSILGLDELHVEGQVNLEGAVLRGAVRIISEVTGARPDLGGSRVLENVTLRISRDGRETRQSGL